MRRKALASAALGLALITGCSGTVDADKAPEDAINGVRDVKEAFEEAGGHCSDWEQHDKMVLAKESGSCGTNAALSWFGDDQDGMDETLATFELLEIQAIVGEGWVIQTTQFDGDGARLVAQKMHGDVVG